MSEVITVPKRGSTLFIIGLLALGVAVVWSLYLSFTKAAIINQQKSLSVELKSLDERFNALKSQKIEATQVIKDFLNKIEKEEVRWSNVISSLQLLTPLESASKKAKIQFLSYSGAGGGKLTMSSQTDPNSADPYADIAELLKVFNNSAVFSDAYVPAISRGMTQTGSVILSFTFDLIYKANANK